MTEEIQSKDLNLEKDEKDSSTLSELFNNAFETYQNIEKTDQLLNTLKVQSDIKQTMRMFEDATKLVSVVDMFSDNESIEEIATENIKYLLLPALLGMLTNKICIKDRLHLVEVAEIYFVDFLKRLKAYNVIHDEIPEINSSDKSQDTNDSQTLGPTPKMLEDMVNRRKAKIESYKQEKELKSRIETLKQYLDNPNIDDEIKREYFVTLLKLFAVQIIHELHMLSTEKLLLEKLKEMPIRTLASESQKTQKHRHPAPKLQPVIITRDKMQKKVFGAGYPSLPVLTVEEFYEKRIKDGDWPDPSQFSGTSSQCLQDMAIKDNSANEEDSEAILKEKIEEKDDPEHLERTRAMDEYKDMHRRGWGNRANRS